MLVLVLAIVILMVVISKTHSLCAGNHAGCNTNRSTTSESEQCCHGNPDTEKPAVSARLALHLLQS